MGWDGIVNPAAQASFRRLCTVSVTIPKDSSDATIPLHACIGDSLAVPLSSWLVGIWGGTDSYKLITLDLPDSI